MVATINIKVKETIERGGTLSIGIGEIFVILLIAFLVVGPEDLPKIARTLALWVKKIRHTMKELTSSFENEMNIEETKKNIRKVSSEVEKAQAELLKHATEQNRYIQTQIEDVSKNSKA